MLSMEGEASCDLFSQKNTRYCSCQRVEEWKEEEGYQWETQGMETPNQGDREGGGKMKNVMVGLYTGRDSDEEHLK